MKKQLLLLFVCSLFILSIGSVQAKEFSEIYDLNNDWIDGNRDDRYDLVYSDNSTLVYFGYSSTRYAFFIESTENLTSIVINGTQFTGDFQNSDLISKVIQNRSEIVMNRAYIGEKIAFGITINNNPEIVIDPFGVLIPPEPTTTDTSTPTTTDTTTNTTSLTGEGIDLLVFFSNVFRSPIFWAILSFLIIFVADYNNHPIVKVSDKHGKLVNLGKFILETNDTKLNKKIFLFSTSTGINEVYCDYSFRSLDIFCFQHVYVIQWDYPTVLYTKLKLPYKISVQQTIKNWKNWILKFLFGIFQFLPFRWISLGIYNRFINKEIQTDEVNYLIPTICLDALEYRFDIEFEQEELNKESYKMEYIKKNQKNVIYSDVLTLKKCNIKPDSLKIILKEVKNIKYPTIKEALEDKHSRFEIVNSYENRTTALEVQIFELEQRLENAYNTIQKQRLEMDEKIRNGLKPMEESNEYLRQNFGDMLSNTLLFRNLGMDEKQAIQKAILEHLDKKDKEKDELKAQIAKLEAKLDKTSKKEKSFNPMEFTINEKKGESEKDE